jgi:hypothetical protein
MKPLFTDEERCQAVRNFIVACYQGEAKVKDYSKIIPYLEEKRVLILNPKLPKSGQPSYGNPPYYQEKDAQAYFEWLVAVTSGNLGLDALINEANNQLFQFIQVLGDSIEKNKNVELVAHYDWQSMFSGWDRELIYIKNTIDHHDKEITDILKSILQFLKQNKTLLETMRKEYEGYFPKSDAP